MIRRSEQLDVAVESPFSMTRSGDQSPHAKPKRRRLRNAAIVVLALLGIGAFIFTRPSVLARLILPAASRAIGGEVTAARIALDGLDTLVIDDLRVRARGWSGEAGEVAYADSTRVEFSLWSLLFGDIEVFSVSVSRLTLRLAEREDTPGALSLLSLAPEPSKAATDRRQRPARIGIEELLVENGLAADGVYEKLGELRFRGSLTPIADSPAAFDFLLEGRPDDEGRRAIGKISGSFDGDTRAVDLAIEGLEIDGKQLAVAPLAVRAWTTRLGLEGSIPSARFAYSPETSPVVELDIKGVAMDLPVDALGGPALEDSWSGLANGALVPVRAVPRLTLREGALRFRNDTVALVGLKGDLGAAGAGIIDLPFECDLTIDIPRDDLPPFDWDKREEWIENAARTAPFTMTAAIRDFRSPEPKAGEPDMLQLPRAVAKVIADFRVTAWTLNLETKVERGAPVRTGEGASEPAPLRTSGTLRIEKGSGAYEEFPYRLDDLSGVIRFENDDVVVERFVGTGADGATVTIEGELVGIATGAEIDLRIRCADAPIDQRLLDSFEEGPRDALGLLFSNRAAASLAEAGLLPDAAALVEQRQALARLGSDDAASPEAARLQRSLDAGPFQLGGRAGLDLRVYSPAGFGQPVIVTGDVKVRDAGLVFDRFPYPLRIKTGSIAVLDEAIVIGGGGLRAVTPAGGTLTVGGSVQIPRDGKGGRLLHPLIELADEDDAINPALLAAIPFADDESTPGWPGKDLAPAGQLLRALGLNGQLDLTGFVTTTPDGKESFLVKLDFERGRAEPDAAGRAWLAAQGLPWPQGFALENCSAKLEITPERVSFEQCRGTRGGGTVEARGFAALNGPDRGVEIKFDDLPVESTFDGYLGDTPEESKARAARFRPRGILDGLVTHTVDAKGALTRGSLVPAWLEATMDGTTVRAEHLAGRLEVNGDTVQADSLELRLASNGADDGLLRLSGPLSASSRPSCARCWRSAPRASSRRFDHATRAASSMRPIPRRTGRSSKSRRSRSASRRRMAESRLTSTPRAGSAPRPMPSSSTSAARSARTRRVPSSSPASSRSASTLGSTAASRSTPRRSPRRCAKCCRPRSTSPPVRSTSPRRDGSFSTSPTSTCAGPRAAILRSPMSTACAARRGSRAPRSMRVRASRRCRRRFRSRSDTNPAARSRSGSTRRSRHRADARSGAGSDAATRASARPRRAMDCASRLRETSAAAVSTSEASSTSSATATRCLRASPKRRSIRCAIRRSRRPSIQAAR
jgi:hypothetical protein